MYCSCIFIFRINFVHFYRFGVFAWGFNCFTLACIKPPNTSGIYLLYLYTQSIVIIQTWNPEVFRSKRFNCFPSAVVFAKTYFTFYPSRAASRQIHSENFNQCLIYRYMMFGRGICEKYQSRAKQFPESNGKTGIFRKYPSQT